MKPETTEIKPTNRKKSLRLLALLCVMCLLLTGCAKVKELAMGMMFIWMIEQGDNHLTQTQIENLILENKEALEESILTGKAEEWEGKYGIQSVYTDAEGHVDFDCGGWGIVPSGGYTGLYFSPEDEPYDIQHFFTNGPLSPQGDDGAWRQEKGGNSYYTQRVTEKFFYYEYQF